MLSVSPTQGPDGQLQLHATTVAADGNAIALVGPTGVGKSSLAIELLAFGATLIADDITWCTLRANTVIASCPPQISGRIEARGVGILKAPIAPPTRLALVIDLGAEETQRLPPHRHITLIGCNIPLLHSLKTAHFAATILHYMRYGRAD